jgi:hypothetical protein
LILTLNGSEIPNSRVGSAAGGSQIVGMCLIEIIVPNSILSLRNAVEDERTLTITRNLGGRAPVYYHLVIKQLYSY